MDETVNKNWNKYAVILIVLNITSIILFSIYAFQTFTSYSNDVLGVATFVISIGTFVYTVYVVNRKVGKIYSIFIVIDVLLAAPGFLVFILGSIKTSRYKSESDEHEKFLNEFESFSDPIKIKETLKRHLLYFYDDRCIEAGIRCFDDDNKINDYIYTLDLHKERYSSSPLSNTTFSSTTNNIFYNITFFDDFSGFKLECDAYRKGFNEKAYYKFDESDAITVKNMVDATIEKQINSHNQLLEDAKSKLSYKYVIDVYQQSPNIVVNYYSPKTGEGKNLDKDAKILNAIINLNKSSFKLVKNVTNFYNSSGFSYYQDVTDHEYEILFCYESQELTLKKNYTDFDEKKSYITLTYEIDIESTNLLMNVAKSVAFE